MIFPYTAMGLKIRSACIQYFYPITGRNSLPSSFCLSSIFPLSLVAHRDSLSTRSKSIVGGGVMAVESCFPSTFPPPWLSRPCLISKGATTSVCGWLIASSKGPCKSSGSSRSSRSRSLMDSIRCVGRVSRVTILLIGGVGERKWSIQSQLATAENTIENVLPLSRLRLLAAKVTGAGWY